jgi:phosphoglycerate dehydrogenase-like enzyme
MDTMAPLSSAAANSRALVTPGESVQLLRPLKGLFVLRPYWFEQMYAAEDRELLRGRVDMPDRPFSYGEVQENFELLEDVELLFSGWDGVTLNKRLLDAAPKLKAVFFSGGSVRGMITDEFWERDILLTNAAAANAVPVAEFTFAQVILALKQAWPESRKLHTTRETPHYVPGQRDMPGAYKTEIGVISLGHIGRRVCQMLRMLEVRVLAYDPYVTEHEADSLGVELVSLTEMFRRCEVVTLHTPQMKETEGLITGRHLASMKRGATIINTARGGIINEPEMIEVLQHRHDLSALLDVTMSEPLGKDSPLFSMPNVFLTPHIAGSFNNECRRMGRSMIEEALRYLNGESLRWAVTRDRVAISA